MISPNEMLALKVAMVEHILEDMLAGHFLSKPDPQAALQQYAERMRPKPQGVDPNAIEEVAWQETWNTLFDRVSMNIRRS